MGPFLTPLSGPSFSSLGSTFARPSPTPRGSSFELFGPRSECLLTLLLALPCLDFRRACSSPPHDSTSLWWLASRPILASACFEPPRHFTGCCLQRRSQTPLKFQNSFSWCKKESFSSAQHRLHLLDDSVQTRRLHWREALLLPPSLEHHPVPKLPSLMSSVPLPQRILSLVLV